MKLEVPRQHKRLRSDSRASDVVVDIMHNEVRPHGIKCVSAYSFERREPNRDREGQIHDFTHYAPCKRDEEPLSWLIRSINHEATSTVPTVDLWLFCLIKRLAPIEKTPCHPQPT